MAATAAHPAVALLLNERQEIASSQVPGPARRRSARNSSIVLMVRSLRDTICGAKTTPQAHP